MAVFSGALGALPERIEKTGFAPKPVPCGSAAARPKETRSWSGQNALFPLRPLAA